MAIQITVMSLDFESFEQPVTHVFTKNEITMGRHSTNDVVLNRTEVSGIHARLRIKNGSADGAPSLFITDLGSSNGTMVESSPLKGQVEMPMQPNQRIIIGTYLIKPALIDLPDEVSTARSTSEESEHNIANSYSNGFHAQSSTSSLEATQSTEDNAHQIGSGTYSRPHAAPAQGNIIALGSSPEVDSSPSEIINPPYFEPEAVVPEATAYHAEVVESNSTIQHEPEAKIYNTSSLSNVAAAEIVTIEVDGHSVENLDFIARELLTLQGSVKHKGTGLIGVTVEAGEIGQSVTTSDGRFSLPATPEGTEYAVTFTKSGYVFNTGSAKVAGTIEPHLSIDVTATQLFSLGGVILHKGKPLAGVSVNGADLGSQTSDMDGKFSFNDILEDSTYSLEVSKDRFIIAAPSNSKGSVSGNVTVEFTARELFTIGGRIIHRGVPMSGVEIDGGILGKTITGPDGTYSFQNVPEGEQYTLKASKDGFVFGTINGVK